MSRVTKEDFQAWKEVFPIKRVFFSRLKSMLTIIFKEIDPEKMDDLISRYIFFLRDEDGICLKSMHFNCIEKSIEGARIEIVIKDIHAQRAFFAKMSIFDRGKVRRKKVEVIN